MLEHVVNLAKKATASRDDVGILVATEDTRIYDYAQTLNIETVMTPDSCPTGTDRAHAAIQAAGITPEIVLNLQGDAPLTPPHFITEMITAFDTTPDADVVTPAWQLTWDQLDALYESKIKTPFSGTTVTVKPNGEALWFSKNIIPAIRDAGKLRGENVLSPVLKHIGLYAYRTKALTDFINLPQSPYEKLEGLEQLRLLENGYKIRVVTVDPGPYPIHGGIDSPEDIAAAEKILTTYTQTKDTPS